MMHSAIRVPAKKLPAKGAVIFLHGLGDSGSGWQFLSQFARQSPAFDDIKFLFPNAPTIPITCNFGMPCPGWFDIVNFTDFTDRPDLTGFLKSCDVVKALIKEQTDSGIPAENIVLGGFSQGAALALANAVLLDTKLAGFVILSGFCTAEETLKKNFQTANLNTPVFQGQGTADSIVKLEWAQEASEFMRKEIGFKDYQFKTYQGMEHSSCEEELQDVIKFLTKVLKL